MQKDAGWIILACQKYTNYKQSCKPINKVTDSDEIHKYLPYVSLSVLLFVCCWWWWCCSRI